MMKTPLMAAAAAGGLGLLVVSTLWAQRTSAPAAAPMSVALVDTSSIVKNSTKLNNTINGLKSEYDAEALKLKKEGEEGNRLTGEYQRLAANDPKKKKMEEELQRLRTDFELHGKRVNDRIRDAETRAFYGMNRELGEELKRYAQATGVQLVLRFEPPPEDMSDPRMVLAEIQKPIVYQRANADVTPLVLDAMNRRSGAANTATRPAAQPKR